MCAILMGGVVAIESQSKTISVILGCLQFISFWFPHQEKKVVAEEDKILAYGIKVISYAKYMLIGNLSIHIIAQYFLWLYKQQNHTNNNN